MHATSSATLSSARCRHSHNRHYSNYGLTTKIQTNTTNWGGDETAPYEVTTNRGCTLKELIEKIKRGTFFGNMWIHEDYGCCFISNYEKKTIEDFPPALMAKVVKQIMAEGGWGRMDFIISL
jgi:hypothetical protein